MNSHPRQQPDPEMVSKFLHHLYIPHDYGPGTLQWTLLSAYNLQDPQAGYQKLFEREAARSRQILVEVAADAALGGGWRDDPAHGTENLVLNTRYSGSASPENLKVAKEEIIRRRALDSDFERRRKNAEHRAQERKDPVRSNALTIRMAQNWTNPNGPLWMAGVEGGAACVSQMLKEEVEPLRFRTARDRLGLRSFPKRPFKIKRLKNFEVGPFELTKESLAYITGFEAAVNAQITQVGMNLSDP